MKRKLVILGVLICYILLFAACESEKNFEVEEKSEIARSGQILNAFYQILEEGKSERDIYRFMDESLSQVSIADADQMIFGLLNYKKDPKEISYDRLVGHGGRFSQEVTTFLKLMLKNQKDPVMAGEEVRLSLGEILTRCVEFENLLLDYADGVLYSYSEDMYFYLMETAVMGGYRQIKGSRNQYMDIETQVIRGEVLDEYLDFMAQQKNTKTAKVIASYVSLLQEGKGELSTEVLHFYDALREILRNMFTES